MSWHAARVLATHQDFEDLHPIPGVCEVAWHPSATNSASPDLLIEVPHGATRTTDFTSLQALLKSPLPEGLVDFFHVTTERDNNKFVLVDATLGARPQGAAQAPQPTR